MGSCVNLSDSESVTIQYQHIKELALMKYEAEEKREQSLIQQSSQMQTVFSFMSAALLMVIPICIQYRGRLELEFFLIAGSTVLGILITSLVLASIAQWRWITKAFPDIAQIKDFIINSDEWDKLLVEYNRIDQIVDLLGRVQTEKSRINDIRVKLLMASMICFYIAVMFIALFFIIGVTRLF